MEYQIRPCEDSNADYIWEMGFQNVQTEENAREERFVFKVVDERGQSLAGAFLTSTKPKLPSLIGCGWMSAIEDGGWALP